MTAEYFPAKPARRNRFGTIAYYKYSARKSIKIKHKINYPELTEWTRSTSAQIKDAFEKHYNKATGKNTKWGIMGAPDGMRQMKELKLKGSFEGIQVTMVFRAQTDLLYSSQYDHLIKCYIYVDPINYFRKEKIKDDLKIQTIKIIHSQENSFASGVAGIDQTTLDDAFEGDPEAYWNID